MAITSRVDVHAHYQLRLVKRIDGKKIVTYGNLGKLKEGRAKDQTLDFTDATDKGALKKAQGFVTREDSNKGPMPEPIKGVVVVKHESEPAKWVAGRLTKAGSVVVTKRPQRKLGTATWLYYVVTEGMACDVGHTRISSRKGR